MQNAEVTHGEIFLLEALKHAHTIEFDYTNLLAMLSKDIGKKYLCKSEEELRQ